VAEAEPVFWRSSGRLADGREIIYFNESPGTGRAQVRDERELAAADGGEGADGGLRWDPLAGEWVMYAAQRQERPYRLPGPDCPLCPSRPDHLTEIPAPGYDVVVFQNRYPALVAPGRCEVVCFTSEHEASFATLSERRARTVFEAWADRSRELGSRPGVEHVYCFENRGEEIGVTLHHPHGQVYAFPFLPPRTAHLAERVRAHRARSGGNLFEEVVRAELDDGRRIVAGNEHWVAFVPQFARWPFEIMLFPRARVTSLAAVGEAARDAFGPVYLDLLRRLDALFGVPMPYIAAWQQAPTEPEFGLHLHVMGMRRARGKLKYQAGTETGAGAWSNDVLPEDAARMLTEAAGA